jgi:secreted trypsin-like serine protease
MQIKKNNRFWLQSAMAIYLVSRIASVYAIYIDHPRDKQSQLREDINDRNTKRNLIVGGTPVSPGEYPSNAFFNCCGGTLIAPDIVLTAASCQYCVEETEMVRIGSTQFNTGKIIDVVQFVPHPDYDYKSHKNDIAIVQMKCASRKRHQVLNYNSTKPFKRDDLITIGFGFTEPEYMSTILLKTKVDHVPISICKKRYKGELEIFGKQMICAGTKKGGSGPCVRDTGGPLYDTDGLQVGIVTHGIGCGLPEYPSIYSRVSYFKSFIDDMIATYSETTPNYC